MSMEAAFEAWRTEALRLVEEVKNLKVILVARDDEIRQLKNANKELLEALHDCEGVEDEDSEF